jgi:Tat protein translocase TatC
MFKFKKQVYSEDMFADTRMSFGDHLEDLRTHLWRALYWFFLMIVGVFVLDLIGLVTGWRIPFTRMQVGVGYPTYQFIISPIRQELSEYRAKRIRKVLGNLADNPDFEDANRPRFVTMSFSRAQLANVFQGADPDILPQLPEEGQRVAYSMVIGRAHLQTAAAFEAMYAKHWSDLKAISNGLSGTIARIPGADNVPDEFQDRDKLDKWYSDLQGQVQELVKESERESSTKAESALLEIQKLLGSRELVTLHVRLDEPVKFFSMISKAEAEVNQLNDPVSLSPMEAFMAYFKVALMCGLVLGSPWIFYHIWSFIAAGLYPHEKRLVNVYLPFSLMLFVAGVLACQFVVIPRAVSALLWFNEWLDMQPQLRFNEWLSFAIMMPLVFGLSFQLPLVMMFLERVGIMTVEGYLSYWKIAFFVIHVLAAILMPTPDILSMEMLAIPLLGLYFLGILLCKMNPQEPESEQTSESDQMVEV